MSYVHWGGCSVIFREDVCEDIVKRARCRNQWMINLESGEGWKTPPGTDTVRLNAAKVVNCNSNFHRCSNSGTLLQTILLRDLSKNSSSLIPDASEMPSSQPMCTMIFKETCWTPNMHWSSMPIYVYARETTNGKQKKVLAPEAESHKHRSSQSND